ncbi:5-oxoprolinase subunit PxpB [Pseudomonas tohonis]|uniref:5-oxoprolinase subunit PxpB n=1 Tax=Pseudomonas tohonis TaxID=2725477 RepID=UPI0021DB4629|nr:5-oxoprolinase subunit PxpB [Pseudomonas tohonis]UXY54025.1 5-oxoprolinase subunit PxpB [Pseudomonas tohonis]
MIRIEPVGAEALLLVLADEPDARLPLRIAQLAESIRQRLGSQLRDLVPGWTTLLLHYDLLRTDPTQLAADLEPLLQQWQPDAVPVRDGRLHELPVWYGGEDLASVARACGLSTAEVIELHSATLYRVGAIGFAPGFAYLGELDTRLALPRRSSPRTRVPAGSLAIAERQTAIYPQASPGGWHLLGLCPRPLFDPASEPPCPLALGDCVRFVPIDEPTYRRERGEP